jgi:hypothetical protein
MQASCACGASSDLSLLRLKYQFETIAGQHSEKKTRDDGDLGRVHAILCSSIAEEVQTLVSAQARPRCGGCSSAWVGRSALTAMGPARAELADGHTDCVVSGVRPCCCSVTGCSANRTPSSNPLRRAGRVWPGGLRVARHGERRRRDRPAQLCNGLMPGRRAARRRLPGRRRARGGIGGGPRWQRQRRRRRRRRRRAPSRARRGGAAGPFPLSCRAADATRGRLGGAPRA